MIGLAAALALPARAAPPGPKDADQIARIQAYLNSIQTLQSRFEQVSDDGGVDYGTIYIERPGRMRIVYDPPVPILIVATGDQIYYYDSKLQNVSRTTLDDTPAWFLLRDHIQLGGDVTVTNFEKAADTLRVTVRETKNSNLGEVTIVLSDQPLTLRQWTVLDAQHRTVTVTLQDAKFGVALNPNLFYWTDPRPSGSY
ncbi:MAG TPA: outer membrane lipoprotein carrier protein LolA [Stellaceae bacterium]|nr:outer membrane lipoprotein carrier protein LolA [Stellaceae bacterium]